MRPKPPTLESLARGEGFRVHVRFGKECRRFRIPFTDRKAAEVRAAELEALGDKLGAVDPELAARMLTDAGAATLRSAKIKKLAGAHERRQQAKAGGRRPWAARDRPRSGRGVDGRGSAQAIS